MESSGCIYFSVVGIGYQTNLFVESEASVKSLVVESLVELYIVLLSKT